jgi:predicted ArsR family transcriptional regulator
MKAADRHALLADPTRRGILEALRAAGRPVDVRTLAIALGLRRNSVRDQLRRLEDAGLVHATIDAPAGRGRPRHLYEAGPGSHDDPYRLLTVVLADELVTRTDGPQLGVAAGERWGRASARLARTRAGRGHRARRRTGRSAGDGAAAAGAAASAPATATDGVAGPLATVVEMLDRAGFAPDHPADDDRELRLRACPFLPLEPEHLDVVCGIHLGFIRGALRELDAPVDAVSIEPFLEPGLCVARLAAR